MSVKIIYFLYDTSFFWWVQTNKRVTCDTFLKNNYLKMKLPCKYAIPLGQGVHRDPWRKDPNKHLLPCRNHSPGATRSNLVSWRSHILQSMLTWPQIRSRNLTHSTSPHIGPSSPKSTQPWNPNPSNPPNQNRNLPIHPPGYWCIEYGPVCGEYRKGLCQGL
jgi:hypothetical protein